MVETKHRIKRRILIYLGFSIVTLTFLFFWLWVRGKENNSELIIVANYIMPFLIGFGFLAIIMQFLILDRLNYIKLTDSTLIIYSVFPIKSFKYTDIKSIGYNNGWFKGIDNGDYMKWFTIMKLREPEKFLADLKEKYLNTTKRNLIIEETFL